MLTLFKSKASAIFGLMMAMLLAPAAFAQSTGIDVSGTVTELGQVKTAVISIGVAVLAIFLGIKLYKWIRRAL